MKRFVHDDSICWVGGHKRYGIVLYDPERQQSLRQDRVRLWIPSLKEEIDVPKEVVRKVLQPAKESEMNEIAEKYFKEDMFFVRQLSFVKRSSICRECKRAVASNRSLLCDSCGWIICSECEACGCGYRPKP